MGALDSSSDALDEQILVGGQLTSDVGQHLS
jgi:hypothetical protein